MNEIVASEFVGGLERKLRLLREPSEEALAAGDSMMPQIAPGQDITTGIDALREAWPVMIDVMLAKVRDADKGSMQCTCGAPADGKRADQHTKGCPLAIADDREGTILSICVKCGVNLHPAIAREIAARILERE